MVVEVDGASTWRGADSRETGTCARADTVTADFSRETPAATPAATTATTTTMPSMVPMAATGAVSMLSLALMAFNLVSMVSSFCWGLARGRGGGVGAGVVIVVW
jgi:hypothetical protein